MRLEKTIIIFYQRVHKSKIKHHTNKVEETQNLASMMKDGIFAWPDLHGDLGKDKDAPSQPHVKYTYVNV